MGGTGGGSRTWVLVMLALLLVITLPLAPVFADTGSGGPSGFRGGGEGEGTLPAGVDLGAGLVLVGTLHNLDQAVHEVSGDGEIFLYSLDPESAGGLYLAILHGGISLSLDQGLVQSGAVGVYFSSGSPLYGGTAQAIWGGRTFAPFTLDGFLYELPLGQMFPTTDGWSPWFHLLARPADALSSYLLSIQARDGEVKLIQRSGL